MCGERHLLWSVDSDDVQVTVIHTLFVFVHVTHASLCTSPGPRRVAGGAKLCSTLRGDADEVAHAAGQKCAQQDRFKLPPPVHIIVGRITCRIKFL